LVLARSSGELALVVKAAVPQRPERPLAETISAAVSELSGCDDLARSSVGVYVEHWAKFEAFAATKGYGTASSIDAAVVRAWLAARDGSGTLPAIATQRLRRTSVRKLFHFLRAIGAASQDPTIDIQLPPRTSLINRPLDDDEVDECRWASRSDFTSWRYPAVWALAEAGATMTELPQVLLSDVDVEKGVVLLRGSPRTARRVVPLFDWGAAQLERVVATAVFAPGVPIVYGGEGATGRRSTMAGTVRRIYTQAGLDRESDVTTESVRAWLGRSMREQGEPIERVARRLGMRSVDRTFLLVGEDWQSQEA
jgi:integrase/recombinase XerC